MKTRNHFTAKKGGATFYVSLFILLLTFCPVMAQNARVQFIHASPYPELSAVDVYIDGAPFLEDISFMEAGAYQEVPAGAVVTIDITSASDSDNSDPVYSKVVQLLDDRPYVIALVGDPLFREGEPAMELVLKIDAPEKKDSRSYYSFVDFVELNAVPDAGSVRSRLEGYTFFGQRGLPEYLEWLDHGEFSYLLHSVPGGTFWMDQYLMSRGPHARLIADYNGLQGQGVVKVCSGFIEPPTSYHDGLTCALFAADGSSTEMEVQQSQVQIINASPYKDAGKVDVWIDGYRWADNLSYAGGTPFLSIAPGTRSIHVTRADDKDERFKVKFFNLPEDRDIAMIIYGDPQKVLGDGSMEIASTLDARAKPAYDGRDGLKVFNAIVDVPSIDILLDAAISDSNTDDPPPVVDPYSYFVKDLAYGSFTSDYIPGDDFEHLVSTRSEEKGLLNLKRVNFGNMPEEEMPGINVQAGFVNPVEGGPSSVIDFTVFPDGTSYTSELVAGNVQFINGSAYPESQKVDIYAGSLKVADDLEFRSGTGFIPVLSGVRSIKIVPSDEDDNKSYWLQQWIPLMDSRDYAIVIGGGPEKTSENSEMKLHTKYLGHQEAMSPNTAEILDINLIQDRETIMIEELVPFSTVIAHLDYGSFNVDHAVFDTDEEEYMLACDYSEGGPAYPFLAADFDGEALIMLHAGFADPPDGYPAYQATIIRADGSSLTTMLSDRQVQSEVPGKFALKGNYPNPFNPVTSIAFDLPTAAEVSVVVFDMLGRSVLTLSPTPMAAGFDQHIQVNASGLASGMYVYRLKASFDETEKFETGRMVLLK